MTSPRTARVCYLCGKTEAELGAKLTQDHIIADCFFPQPKPKNLLTLPCCVSCQKEYRKDEEYVRNSLVAISNLSANKDAHYGWKKAHRGLQRRPALYADFGKRMFPFEVQGATFWGLKISQGRTEKVLRKIALGLHYHRTGVLLPANVETDVYPQPKTLLDDILKQSQYKGYFGETFSYAGAVSAEGDAVWWLSFYASVLFIVVLRPRGREEKTVSPQSIR
jgi:hypothetical protein